MGKLVNTTAILASILLFTFGCVSEGPVQESNVVVKKVISANSWSISFKYDNISVETTKLADGSVEKTVKDFGQSGFNLLLLDDIYSRLKYNHNIVIEKNNKDADAHVKIHAVIVPGTYRYSYLVEIIILDRNMDLLTRTLIQTYDTATNGINNISSKCVEYILDFMKK